MGKERPKEVANGLIRAGKSRGFSMALPQRWSPNHFFVSTPLGQDRHCPALVSRPRGCLVGAKPQP